MIEFNFALAGRPQSRVKALSAGELESWRAEKLQSERVPQQQPIKPSRAQQSPAEPSRESPPTHARAKVQQSGSQSERLTVRASLHRQPAVDARMNQSINHRMDSQQQLGARAKSVPFERVPFASRLASAVHLSSQPSRSRRSRRILPSTRQARSESAISSLRSANPPTPIRHRGQPVPVLRIPARPHGFNRTPARFVLASARHASDAASSAVSTRPLGRPEQAASSSVASTCLALKCINANSAIPSDSAPVFIQRSPAASP